MFGQRTGLSEHSEPTVTDHTPDPSVRNAQNWVDVACHAGSMKIETPDSGFLTDAMVFEPDTWTTGEAR